MALAANGLRMLFDPAGWYAVSPGVPETGPLNPHFVRDIDCAYILTGCALAGYEGICRAGMRRGRAHLTSDGGQQRRR